MLTSRRSLRLTRSRYHRILTGITIDCIEKASLALAALHGLGPTFVAITSSTIGIRDDAEEGVEFIHLLGSYRATTTGAASDDQKFLIRCPKLPAYFTGTGDLLAALLLAHLHTRLSLVGSQAPSSVGRAFRTACEIAVSVIQGVLQRTMEHYRATGDRGNMSEDLRVKCTELRLIQCRELLVKTEVSFSAEDWPL